MLLIAVASLPLFSIPAAAITVANDGKSNIKLGIEQNGSPMETKDIAAGKSVTFNCESGCGLSGPWQGVEWAKGDETFKTDGKTISGGAL